MTRNENPRFEGTQQAPQMIAARVWLMPYRVGDQLDQDAVDLVYGQAVQSADAVPQQHGPILIQQRCRRRAQPDWASRWRPIANEKP